MLLLAMLVRLRLTLAKCVGTCQEIPLVEVCAASYCTRLNKVERDSRHEIGVTVITTNGQARMRTAYASSSCVDKVMRRYILSVD